MSGLGQLLGRGGPLSPWGKPAGPRIFLSYRRRGDGAGFAARLADRLVQHFGANQVFRDVEDIESGVDFVEAIQHAVAACQVVIVVIGTDWLDMRDASGQRRLDNPRDFVRLEISAALQRNIRVVPVLVCGATMPSEEQLPPDIAGLSRRQAHELSDTRWDYDMGQLLRSLESIGIRPARAGATRMGQTAKTPFLKRPAVLIGGGALLMLLGLGALLELLPAGGQVDPTLLNGLSLPQSNVPRNAARNPGANTALQDPKSGATTASPPSPGAQAEQEVLQTVARSAERRIFAEQAMDPQALAQVYTGIALQYQVGRLQYLATQGEISVSTLEAQNVIGVQLSPDGRYATVDLEETWSAQHISALTRECAHRLPRHTIRQRALLTRISGPWLIYSLEYDPSYVEPAAVYC